MSSIAKPISKPPPRLAASVPRGSVGNTGFSMTPSPQRSQAPIAAPPPTAIIPLQGIRCSFHATRHCDHADPSADKLIHIPGAKTDAGIMLPAHLDFGEHILVSDLLSGLVEIDHGAADVEEGDHLVAIGRTDQAVNFARRL